MFGKLFKPKLTEENVVKEMGRFKFWFFERTGFAKEYVGVEAFQKRDDLREEFLKRFTEEMKTIVTGENPLYFFRKKIIDNTKVLAINSVLLKAEFDKTRDAICDSIDRGMKHYSDTPLEKAKILIEEVEVFFDEPWSYKKIVHEFSWAEVESLALRHMQAFLFKEKVDYDDWWSIFRKAYEEYFEKVYQLIASQLDKPEGFPHPLLIALTNDALNSAEEKILKAVKQ